VRINGTEPIPTLDEALDALFSLDLKDQDAVNGKVPAPVSVRLATADVGCLGGIRAEVVGGKGIFAGHRLAAQGL
jgi:hypothetical protein